MVVTTKHKEVSTSHIPDDICFDILSKLPLKSRKRFTCVKKSWALMFQNPNFFNTFCTNFFISQHRDNDAFLLVKVKTQMDPSRESLCVLFGDRLKDRVRLDWPPVFQENEDGSFCVQILVSNSVNGFLCLYQNNDNDTTTTILWNPSTGVFNTVPPSLQPYENFEFTSRPHAFGYDWVSDDYKVIRKVQYPTDFEGNWVYVPNKDHPFWETDVHELDIYDDYWEEEELIVKVDEPFWEMYSLQSNSWRKLDGVNMSVSFQDKSHLNLNGLSHWLTQRNHMVSFDFSNETFFETTLPSESRMGGDLIVLNGSLSLISDHVYDNTTCFNIWILGELGVMESWTKLFIVGPLPYIMYPIGSGKKSDIFFRKINNKLVWFDCSTRRIVEIGATRDLFCLQTVIYK